MAFLHILNGGALHEKIKRTSVPGKVIVFGECLVEGPVAASIDDQFWQRRNDFVFQDFGDSDYYQNIRQPLEWINLSKNDDLILWFENDLFCQVNYWFLLKYFNQLKVTGQIYRVYPAAEKYDPGWGGFGPLLTADLQFSFGRRVPLCVEDIQLGAMLWSAYAEGNSQKMIHLASYTSQAFQKLPEVIQAQLERGDDDSSRPMNTLKDLVASGLKSFPEIFQAFSLREGVYGYGDTHVKKLLKRLHLSF